MTRCRLDTNTVGHLLKQHPAVVGRVPAVPMSDLCVSVVTEAELPFGLARRPDAKRLRRAVGEVLKRVAVLPRDTATTAHHGPLRAGMEQRGRVPAPLDLLIAAHAASEGAVLVTDDRAFARVPGLRVENWT